jgi:flagellar basal-body rod modification protein FlgD
MSPISSNTVSSDLMSKMNSSATATSSTADAQNKFLTLLVTQMKNQDPLNPMDNSQVTSQLAQLSTVSGIDKLNTTLSSFVSSMQSDQAVGASNMIGRGVLSPGSTAQLSGGAAPIGVDLASPADNVKVTIHDAAGHVVRTMDLGAFAAGTQTSTWDGKTDSGATSPDGKYTFDVAATQAGNTIGATAMSFGVVASVSSGPQGTKLNLANNQSIALTDVRQIL